MDLARYTSEMEKINQRRVQLETVIQDLDSKGREEQDSRLALVHLKSFC
jgi:cell division protein FtsB